MMEPAKSTLPPENVSGSTTRKLQDLDRACHIHPLTDHRLLHQQGTHVIVSGQGCWLTDSEGKRLLDAMAGLWCVNVGYGRQEIVDAVARQMSQLPYYTSALNSTTEPTILLADRLAAMAPPQLTHLYFSSSGSEGNEAALKIIRFYNRLIGQPERTKILTRRCSYHGGTLATSSMAGIPATYQPYILPLPGFISDCPTPYRYAAGTEMGEEEYGRWCLEETERIIQREDPSTIAALFAEPVQAAGGVIVPPPGYLKALRELCRRHSILFVADEVVTGYGRLGAWFASRLWSLEPDLMTTAKAVTSAYLPLSALFVHDRIAQVLINGGVFSHVNTYSGHPAATAAALANLDIMESEGLISRAAATSPYFLQRLGRFRDHPAIGDFRGTGLIAALELRPREGQPPPAAEAYRLYRNEGVIIRAVGHTICFCPPLIISEEEIDLIAQVTERVLDKLAP